MVFLGGAVMYVILLVFLAGVFISVERTISFRRNYRKKDFILGEGCLENDNSSLSGIVENKGVRRLASRILCAAPVGRDEALSALQEVMTGEIPLIERNLNLLKSLASLAPLLGLLGTVTGMISLFDVITAFGTGDPKLLAGGISEALVTTEFGLIVAIPAVLAHRLLQNRADETIASLEETGLALLNRYTPGGME